MPIRYKPTDPQGQQEDLNRRRALADRLQQPAPAPEEWNRQPIYPGMSGSAATARLASVLLGKWQGHRVKKEQDALDTGTRKAYADQLRGIVSQPIQPGQPGSGVLQPGARAPLSSQQEAAVGAVGAMPLEQQGPMLAQASLGRLMPKPAEPYTLSAGQQRRGPGNELLAQAPPNAAGETGMTGSLQEIDRQNEYNRAHGLPEINPAEYLAQRRGSSADSQLYAQSTKDLPPDQRPRMDQFLQQQRGAVAGAEAEAKAGVIPADERVTAQNKEPRLEAAARRLQRVSEASQALEGNTILSGGPLQGGVIGLTEKGGELDQANAQLLTELTALTRTPGLGSQSDFEQRLAQLVLPTANMYPSVRKKAVDELESYIGDLGSQIRKIGSGNAAPAGQPAQQAQAPQGVDPETWKFLTPEERALWR